LIAKSVPAATKTAPDVRAVTLVASINRNVPQAKSTGAKPA
jgi:hypothetical protein